MRVPLKSLQEPLQRVAAATEAMYLVKRAADGPGSVWRFFGKEEVGFAPASGLGRFVSHPDFSGNMPIARGSSDAARIRSAAREVFANMHVDKSLLSFTDSCPDPSLNHP